MIDLYHLPITKKAGDYSAKLLSYVSPERQRTIARYHFESDRLLSLYGALLIRMGISQRKGISPKTLNFSVGENGKPYVRNHPNSHFNLSHTKGRVICGIGEQSPLGIDIEIITSTPPFEIMWRYFHPQEISYINSGESFFQAYRFYEIWTRKEALLKRSGEGLVDCLEEMNTLEFVRECESWRDEHYVWSVSFSQQEEMNNHYLSELDILKFFGEEE